LASQWGVIELAIHVVTALYIPLLWYLIGKRLDVREKRKCPPLSRGLSLAWIGCGILAV
jgi:hypothetical protein